MEFESFIVCLIFQFLVHLHSVGMVHTTHARKVLKCLSCNDVDTVDACMEERSCALGQYCFLDKYSVFVRDFGGNDKEIFKYNAGCRNSSICHDAQCLGLDIGGRNHTVGKRRSISPIHCTECCLTDRCNLYLCDFLRTGSDARRCYSCSDVRHPKDCNDVTYCQPDEKCLLIEEIRINPDESLSPVYQQRCEKRQLCKAVYEHNTMRITTATTKEHNIIGTTTQSRPTTTKSIVELTPPPLLRSLLSYRRSHNLIQINASCCDDDYCNNFEFGTPVRNPKTTSAPSKYLCPTTTRLTTTTTHKETTTRIPTQTTSTEEPNPVAIIG